MAFDITTIKNTIKDLSGTASSYVNKIPTTQDLINLIYNQFPVVKPKSGYDGIVFQLIEKQSINFESDISQHILEDGTIIQDHIVHKPIKLTLIGLQAEETFQLQTLSQGGEYISKQLGTIGNYAPEFTNGMQQQFNAIYAQTTQITNYIDSAVQNTKSFFDFLGGFVPADSKQAELFYKLYVAWYSKTPRTIELPIGDFDPKTRQTTTSRALENMVIRSISWDMNTAQTGKTLSNVRVEFEQIRTTTAKTYTYIKQDMSTGKTAKQTAPIRKPTQIKPKPVQAPVKSKMATFNDYAKGKLEIKDWKEGFFPPPVRNNNNAFPPRITRAQ
jgi:hypothetical protein